MSHYMEIRAEDIPLLSGFVNIPENRKVLLEKLTYLKYGLDDGVKNIQTQLKNIVETYGKCYFLMEGNQWDVFSDSGDDRYPQEEDTIYHLVKGYKLLWEEEVKEWRYVDPNTYYAYGLFGTVDKEPKKAKEAGFVPVTEIRLCRRGDNCSLFVEDPEEEVYSKVYEALDQNDPLVEIITREKDYVLRVEDIFLVSNWKTKCPYAADRLYQEENNETKYWNCPTRGPTFMHKQTEGVSSKSMGVGG